MRFPRKIGKLKQSQMHYYIIMLFNRSTHKIIGRSQNTIPIASTQVARKGTVQYSTGDKVGQSQSVSQLATRHSREHTLSTVSPDAQVE